jgi:hypothetical protein
MRAIIVLLLPYLLPFLCRQRFTKKKPTGHRRPFYWSGFKLIFSEVTFLRVLVGAVSNTSSKLFLSSDLLPP